MSTKQEIKKWGNLTFYFRKHELGFGQHDFQENQL